MASTSTGALPGRQANPARQPRRLLDSSTHTTHTTPGPGAPRSCSKGGEAPRTSSAVFMATHTTMQPTGCRQVTVLQIQTTKGVYKHSASPALPRPGAPTRRPKPKPFPARLACLHLRLIFALPRAPTAPHRLFSLPCLTAAARRQAGSLRRPSPGPQALLSPTAAGTWPAPACRSRWRHPG